MNLEHSKKTIFRLDRNRKSGGAIIHLEKPTASYTDGHQVNGDPKNQRFVNGILEKSFVLMFLASISSSVLAAKPAEPTPEYRFTSAKVKNVFMEPRDVVRSAHQDGSAGECFDIYVPNAGILHVEVATRNLSEAKPFVAVSLAENAEKEGFSELFSAESRWQTGVSVAADGPGVFAVCVGLLESLGDSEEYKVISYFSPFGGEVAVSPGGALEEEEDPEEEEPIPDPFILSNLEEEEDPEEEEPIPDPWSTSFPAMVAELCVGAEPDDHGDTFGCATRLGLESPAAGEIWSRSQDDADVFTFFLPSRARVEIFTSGDMDTVGGLYDRFGRKLAVDDDGGEADNFHLGSELSAGRYFVRVEGRNFAQGDFLLTVSPEG